jgi:hypothetical protein
MFPDPTRTSQFGHARDMALQARLHAWRALMNANPVRCPGLRGASAGARRTIPGSY